MAITQEYSTDFHSVNSAHSSVSLIDYSIAKLHLPLSFCRERINSRRGGMTTSVENWQKSENRIVIRALYAKGNLSTKINNEIVSDYGMGVMRKRYV